MPWGTQAIFATPVMWEGMLMHGQQQETNERLLTTKLSNGQNLTPNFLIVNFILSTSFFFSFLDRFFLFLDPAHSAL